MSRNTIATAGVVGVITLIVMLFAGAAISAMAFHAMQRSGKTIHNDIRVDPATHDTSANRAVRKRH
jgi:hypothetical protein